MKLLIIESSDIGARFTAEAALKLGYEPLFVCNLKNYQADPLRQIRQFTFIDCDTSSAASIIEALSKANVGEIGGVITFLDSRLIVAVEVAKLLQVPGLSDSLLLLKDKAQVVDLLPEYSPQTIAFDRSSVPKTEVMGLLEGASGVVIKPSQTAGAIGTQIASDEVSLAQILSELDLVQVPKFLDNGVWLAQQRIQGALYSVEGYVQDWSVKILGYSDRGKIGNTESRIDFPVDERLAMGLRTQVKHALNLLVQRSGFRFGYFHVEFIASCDQVYVIDANMGRLGGGTLGAQLPLAYGIEAADLYAHVIDVSIFSGSKRIPAPDRATPVATRGVLYGVANETTVTRLLLPKSASCHHTQVLDLGVSIPAMGQDNWAWLGLACGEINEVDGFMRNLRLETSSGEQAACFARS